MCKVPPENHRRPGLLLFPALPCLYSSIRLILLFFPSFWQIENSFSLSVPIFKQFHKNIIGKGGTNIKKVRFRLFLLLFVYNRHDAF